jgi:hypothetical protein
MNRNAASNKKLQQASIELKKCYLKSAARQPLNNSKSLDNDTKI